MRRPTNISFDGRPIEIVVNSAYLVLLDPLVLDGLRANLQSLAGCRPAERAGMLRNLPGPMRIGVHEITGFRPGNYRLAASDLEAFDEDNVSDDGVCDVDSGAIIIADIGKLDAIATILTRERYDYLLRSPLEDDSRYLALIDELGGPYFGLLNPADGTAFNGDGSYKLREGSPITAERPTPTIEV